MNEEMRKEFDEWYVGKFGFIPNCPSGMSIHAQSKLEAWQASREAMKPIELPYSENGKILRKEACESIKQAGYKVEE